MDDVGKDNYCEVNEISSVKMEEVFSYFEPIDVTYIEKANKQFVQLDEFLKVNS